jgi:hypothetical protein
MLRQALRKGAHLSEATYKPILHRSSPGKGYAGLRRLARKLHLYRSHSKSR